VALLAAGIWYRSLPLRAASAAVVVLTVLKVFLIDMGGLTASGARFPSSCSARS
jgi:uncharacterized membrane protein